MKSRIAFVLVMVSLLQGCISLGSVNNTGGLATVTQTINGVTTKVTANGTVTMMNNTIYVNGRQIDCRDQTVDGVSVHCEQSPHP